MDISVLYSGSKGNCTLVETNTYNILIDVGTSMRKIEEGLLLSPHSLLLSDIDFILITHVHEDHVKSFGTIYNKHEHITFILDQQLLNDIEDKFKRKFDKERFIFVDSEKKGKELNIQKFSLQHDVYCVGWIIIDMVDNESLCFISDNAEKAYHMKDILFLHKPHTYYMIESNYDNYLQYTDTKRNTMLKRRVLGSSGHSDNFNAVNKLVSFLEWSESDRTKAVIFHHLSEDCNSEELAINSHNSYIEVWGKKTITKNIKFLYAKQHEIVSTIE